MTELTFSENDLQSYYDGLDSLAHHGILGQRWGRKNGPPYPLDESDHSASEKKAGWRQSLSDASDALKRKLKKSEPDQNESQRQKEETPEEREARIKAEKRAIITSANANLIKEHANELTYQELQEAVNRMDLMQKVDRNVTFPPTTFEKLQNGLEKVSKTVDFAENGLKTYNRIARITNNIMGDESLPVFDAQARKEQKDRERKKLADDAIRSGDPKEVLQAIMDGNIATNQIIAAKTSLQGINELQKMIKDSKIDSTDIKENTSKTDDKPEKPSKTDDKTKKSEKSEKPSKTDGKPEKSSKTEESTSTTSTTASPGSTGSSSGKGKKSKEKKPELSYYDKLSAWASETPASGTTGWTSPEERREREESARQTYMDSISSISKDVYSRNLSSYADDKAYDNLQSLWKSNEKYLRHMLIDNDAARFFDELCFGQSWEAY